MGASLLLQKLVRTPSVNPSLSPGGTGEAGIAALLAERLSSTGAAIRLLEASAGRPSLLAIRPGSGGGRSLFFNAHMDTVGVEGMAGPYSGHIEDGLLYGRGSYDMKSGLAAAVEAFATCRPTRGDLILSAVADEEFGSLGTEEVLRHVRADAAIVTEPTGLDLCVAHKGFLWASITTEGRAAHGSRPDLGTDANLAMGPVLTKLAALGDTLARREPHPLLGHGSLHVATLAGGTGWSTYSDRCTLRVERRLLPGESAEAAFGEIAACAHPHAATLVFHRAPFAADPATPFARLAARTIEKERGRPPAVCGQSPWFDAALLAQAGIETLIVGPAGGGAHAAVEWVDLASVEMLTRILTTLAEEWCEITT